jgi:hypothetical protein
MALRTLGWSARAMTVRLAQSIEDHPTAASQRT